MKIKSITGALTILLCTVNVLPVLSAPQVQVAVDGQYVAFPDASPYVDAHSHRTMVPARFVVEKLGLNVQWNAQLEQVTLKGKDQVIRLTIGQNHAQVNGKSIAFDAPAVIKNSRTMVPLRFISEILQAQIDWIPERHLAVVTTPGHSKVVPPASNQQPQSPVTGKSKAEKGTWIWDPAIIKTDQEKILNFASNNELTTIYLQADKDISSTIYQNFVRSANKKQIKVEALAGKPHWALTHNQKQIKDFITWVKKYNASVGPAERFVGLHFDIEPYLLEEWRVNNQLVIENWMDTMRFIEKEAKGSGLKITVDVPFWIHQVKIPNSKYSFSAWLLEKVDSLVIMDYRNVALGNNGIVENAAKIMREASTLKKQAIVAVDTVPNSEEAATTFHSLSAEAMKKELAIAMEKLSQHASYAGIAIHDYQYWTKLVEKRK